MHYLDWKYGIPTYCAFGSKEDRGDEISCKVKYGWYKGGNEFSVVKGTYSECPNLSLYRCRWRCFKKDYQIITFCFMFYIVSPLLFLESRVLLYICKSYWQDSKSQWFSEPKHWRANSQRMDCESPATAICPVARSKSEKILILLHFMILQHKHVH